MERCRAVGLPRTLLALLVESRRVLRVKTVDFHGNLPGDVTPTWAV